VKYLALIYASDADWSSLSDEDRESMYAQYRAFGEQAREQGALVDGAELQPSTTATTVRVRNDDPVVTDGPFAETKEQLGGYYVLDCESIDDAVALAAKIPGAQYGTIEVRPAHIDEEQGEEGAA
jgi:hypothetical protein